MGSQKRNGAAAVIKALVSSPRFLIEFFGVVWPPLTLQLPQ